MGSQPLRTSLCQALCGSREAGRPPPGTPARKGDGVIHCRDHTCRYDAYLGESLKHQPLNLLLSRIRREVVVTVKNNTVSPVTPLLAPSSPRNQTRQVGDLVEFLLGDITSPLRIA